MDLVVHFLLPSPFSPLRPWHLIFGLVNTNYEKIKNFEPSEAMMVDGGGVIEDGLLDCEQGHLEEGEELAHDQPDVDHADV